jgi:hypothetical protein
VPKRYRYYSSEHKKFFYANIGDGISRLVAHPEHIQLGSGVISIDGEEIFEGDIVQLQHTNLRAIVDFDEGCFCFQGFMTHSEATYWPSNLVVIGNIVEGLKDGFADKNLA